jgi:hypothetical protein
MLGRIAGNAGCRFVACPDVVGDAAATLRLFFIWAPPRGTRCCSVVPARRRPTPAPAAPRAARRSGRPGRRPGTVATLRGPGLPVPRLTHHPNDAVRVNRAPRAPPCYRA